MVDTVALAERYERNPALRALARIIPYGSAVEVAVLTVVGRIREERLQTFFDELATANAIDNPDLVDEEDFVHCFLTTLQFAVNTRRREKIRMFGRLLKSSVSPDSGLSDGDEYEDFLSILDELTYREIRALSILNEFSGTIREESQNEMQWTMTFWEDFCQRLSDDLPLPIDEVADFMKRLGRTGCFHELIGYYDTRPGVGTLTPTYLRLLSFVEERD